MVEILLRGVYILLGILAGTVVVYHLSIVVLWCSHPWIIDWLPVFRKHYTGYWNGTDESARFFLDFTQPDHGKLWWGWNRDFGHSWFVIWDHPKFRLQLDNCLAAKQRLLPTVRLRIKTPTTVVSKSL